MSMILAMENIRKINDELRLSINLVGGDRVPSDITIPNSRKIIFKRGSKISDALEFIQAQTAIQELAIKQPLSYNKDGRDILIVPNSIPVPMNIRLVFKGEKYGLDDCITHERDEPLVEFYDARHMHTDIGQFVSRYGISSLKGEDGFSNKRKPGVGINLNGGVKDWKMDGVSLDAVISWADAVINEREMRLNGGGLTAE